MIQMGVSVNIYPAKQMLLKPLDSKFMGLQITTQTYYQMSNEIQGIVEHFIEYYIYNGIVLQTVLLFVLKVEYKTLNIVYES